MPNDTNNAFQNGHSVNGKAPTTQGKSWADYLWIIRENWILGLVVAVFLSGFFIYRESQTVPLYRSSAILLFELQKDQVINIQEVVDTSLGRADSFVLKNHLTDLRSNSFRGRVVNSLSEEELDLITRDYREPDSEDAPNPHAIIAGANHINIIGGNIFNFEFHHRNPEAAALLANRFSDEFNDFLMERARKANEAALRWLRSQSEELKLKVERSELAVQQYRQERNLVSLEESQNLIVERMKNVSGALNQARVQLLNLSAGLEHIEAAEGDLDELAKLPTVNRMGILPSKFEQRSALLAQRQGLSLRYGERHPRMIENATALETIESEIRKTLEKNVSDFRQEYATLETRVATLQEALAAAEKEALDLDKIAIEYNVLRRKLDTDTRLFTQVHQRLNEAVLASQLGASSLRVVDRAWPSSEPFTPDNQKIYSMGVLIFIATFGGVPFAIHFLNLRLKSASDIEELLQIPFLGEIRRFSKKLGNLNRLVLASEDPQAVENFRQIHSQILLRNKRLVSGHTFVITSALPKEGKSFFAINLAASFSRHHYNTLLIDLDLRRPSVAKCLKEDLGKLVPYQLQPGAVIPLAENLKLNLPGEQGVDATEFIESKEFREMLQRFRSEFDIIVVDAPPAGLFPDAGLIGQFAEHFIFLTQLNKHRRANLKAILNRLEQSQARILGMVVNKVTRGTARNIGVYKYEDYSKYKSYYSHPVKT